MGIEHRVKAEEYDAGESAKRMQLWFAYRERLDAAARFCSDWLLVIDGTFNTNKVAYHYSSLLVC